MLSTRCAPFSVFIHLGARLHVSVLQRLVAIIRAECLFPGEVDNVCNQIGVPHMAMPATTRMPHKIDTGAHPRHVGCAQEQRKFDSHHQKILKRVFGTQWLFALAHLLGGGRVSADVTYVCFDAKRCQCNVHSGEAKTERRETWHHDRCCSHGGASPTREQSCKGLGHTQEHDFHQRHKQWDCTTSSPQRPSSRSTSSSSPCLRNPCRVPAPRGGRPCML